MRFEAFLVSKMERAFALVTDFCCSHSAMQIPTMVYASGSGLITISYRRRYHAWLTVGYRNNFFPGPVAG